MTLETRAKIVTVGIQVDRLTTAYITQVADLESAEEIAMKGAMERWSIEKMRNIFQLISRESDPPVIEDGYVVEEIKT